MQKYSPDPSGKGRSRRLLHCGGYLRRRRQAIWQACRGEIATRSFWLFSLARQCILSAAFFKWLHFSHTDSAISRAFACFLEFGYCARPERHHGACLRLPRGCVCAEFTDEEAACRMIDLLNQWLAEIIIVAGILCIVMAVLWKRRK
jgi:hypothetical protein